MKTLFKKRFGHHAQEIVQGASISLLIRIGSAAIAFLFNIVIVRKFGADSAGLYFLALGVVTISSVVGRFGLENTVLRFVASEFAKSDWGRVTGAFYSALKIASLLSLAIAFLIVALSAPIAVRIYNNPELVPVLAGMALAILPLTASNMAAQALRGLKKIPIAIAVQTTIAPLVNLVGLLIVSSQSGMYAVVACYLTGVIASTAVGFLSWRMITDRKDFSPARVPARTLLLSGVPFFWITIFQLSMVWASTLIVGYWLPPADVAMFWVAHRTAAMMSLLLVAVESIAAPKYASLYAQGRRDELREVARFSALASSLLAVGAMLFIIILSKPILSLFGSGFESGYLVLSMLAVAHFVRICSGSALALHAMSGREKLVRNIAALSAIINLAGCLVLIPLFGTIGAAFALFAAWLLQSVLSVGAVWREFGFNMYSRRISG